jgi:hypothetical protein
MAAAAMPTPIDPYQRNWEYIGRPRLIGRLRFFQLGGRRGFNGSQQRSALRRDLPAAPRPNDQSLAEDVKARRPLSDAFRSIRPIPAAGNKDRDVPS